MDKCFLKISSSEHFPSSSVRARATRNLPLIVRARAPTPNKNTPETEERFGEGADPSWSRTRLGSSPSRIEILGEGDNTKLEIQDSPQHLMQCAWVSIL
ncbi:hypothetical protein SESBI_29817 [Sesbania bispinosa]|nr:hypothetical protein SESBI_29817 [Sesbania bispinosa]